MTCFCPILSYRNQFYLLQIWRVFVYGKALKNYGLPSESRITPVRSNVVQHITVRGARTGDRFKSHSHHDTLSQHCIALHCIYSNIDTVIHTQLTFVEGMDNLTLNLLFRQFFNSSTFFSLLLSLIMPKYSFFTLHSLPLYSILYNYFRFFFTYSI